MFLAGFSSLLEVPPGTCPVQEAGVLLSAGGRRRNSESPGVPPNPLPQAPLTCPQTSGSHLTGLRPAGIAGRFPGKPHPSSPPLGGALPPGVPLLGPHTPTCTTGRSGDTEARSQGFSQSCPEPVAAMHEGHMTGRRLRRAQLAGPGCPEGPPVPGQCPSPRGRV